MSVPLLIFDIDGTVTDSVVAHQSCYNTALKKLGLAKDDGFSTYKHHTDRYIFREIFFQNHDRLPSEEEISEFYTLLTSLFEQQNINAIKGASTFIKLLIKEGIPYVFATGSILQPALKKLSVVNVHTPEPMLSTSDQTDSRDDIVLAAIDKARRHYNKKQFDRKIIIGDGKWDYITAVNLGLSFMGIGSDTALKTMLKKDSSALWKNFNGYTPKDLERCAV